ncbi:glycine betaine ABC transporter substrate-binding protein [Thalassoglobus sp.]|uniref:ABC transporter permease/substrate-binding protein n=1 Tax=Thalassoglobus sp. TaxID=2795869 RepID=UPI003AA8557F
MKRLLMLCVALTILGFAPLDSSPGRGERRIGSKSFTESVILGECLRVMFEESGSPARHLRELGGTRLVYDSLRNGEIDVYAEYTGTIREEILSEQEVESLDEMRKVLGEQGVEMSDPLGFNNSYALAMHRHRADELGVKRISDLTAHSDLIFGLSNEFMDREDGWPNLHRSYGLQPKTVSGLDHDLAYRQLDLGVIDVIDAYSTDAKIQTHDLVLLEDDRAYFPRYDAVLLYRADLADRDETGLKSLLRLTGQIDEATMLAANARVEVDRVSESEAASELIETQLGFSSHVQKLSAFQRISRRTLEHLDLVRRSLIPAILFAIPLGVFAAKRRMVGAVVLSVAGIFQTIPALALLVLLMPVMHSLGLVSVGLGSSTAIVALMLYSLLPIVRNTHSGIQSITPQLQESAQSLGVSSFYRLFHIELPLAARSILAGIKTAAVMNVGFATLGALIGAGGFGQSIITGIRLNDTQLILEGAIPAAVLALAVQFAFDTIETLWLGQPTSSTG